MIFRENGKLQVMMTSDKTKMRPSGSSLLKVNSLTIPVNVQPAILSIQFPFHFAAIVANILQEIDSLFLS